MIRIHRCCGLEEFDNFVGSCVPTVYSRLHPASYHFCSTQHILFCVKGYKVVFDWSVEFSNADPGQN